MCSPTSIQTLLAVAAALTLFSVRAERTSNSFFTIEGEGVRIASDGGVCVDAGASGPVTLTARSGWLVNGRESIVYPSPKGAVVGADPDEQAWRGPFLQSAAADEGGQARHDLCP